MASVQTSSYDGRYLKLTVTAAAGTSSQNYSTVYWTIESIGGNTMYYSIYSYYIVVDGVTRDGDGSTVGWSSYKFPAATGSKSGSFTVQHNNDGTPPRAISFALHGRVSYAGDENKTGSINLSTIPRYFSSTPSISLQSKTETSMTYSWSTSETCSQITWNGGGTASITGVPGRSGTITVTGLTANTSYSHYATCKRSDSGLTSNSNTSTNSTYDYPKINSTPNLTIGNQLTIGIYNPLNRSVQVYIKGADNTQHGGDTTTGTGISGYNNASWKSWWYSTIPNLNYQNTATYKVRLVCSALSRDTTVNGGTYKIAGTETPTFSANNWSYSANLTALTNNNQTIINGYSKVTYSINTQATSNYGASISSYTFVWGNKTAISTGSNSITGGNGNILSCIAVDSRGLTNAQPKTLVSGQTYVPYTTPTLDYSYSYTHRNNGIEAGTKLNLQGKLSVMKFGTNGVANAIYSAKYQVWDDDNSRWSSEYNIPVNNFTLANDGTFTLTDFNIHANGSSGGFAVSKRYTIRVVIKDGQGLLGTLTSANIIVTDGKIARDVYQDSNGDYHQGINGMADENYIEKIYGDECVDGKIQLPSEIKKQLLKNKSGAWIQDRDTSPVANKNPGTGGDYAPACSVKTKNGNWTIGAIDNLDTLYFNYTTDEDYANNTNNSTRWRLPIRGNNLNSIENLALIAYPVGSIYISATPTNPGTIFGGTWQQLKNHFLFATNATSGNKGKDAVSSHTGTNVSGTALSVNQIPSHRHQGLSWLGDDTTQSITLNGGSSGKGYNLQYYGGYTPGQETNIQTGATGGGQTHNHSVSYIEVYVWQRTA